MIDIEIKEKVKLTNIIVNFDENKIYQIQNLNSYPLRIIQGDNTERNLKLIQDMCFLFQKGTIDYYIEPWNTGTVCNVNYWELEE